MKTYPYELLVAGEIPDGLIATVKLTSQAKDKHLVIPGFQLDASLNAAVTFDANIVVDAILTTVVDGALAEAGNVVLTISNGAVGGGNIISTVTIAQNAADLEVDNGTTPDATHKNLTAGTPLQVTASTPAAAAKHADVHIIFHEAA